MHQYRFVRTVRQIHYTERNGRFFSPVCIRKIKFGTVQTNRANGVGMCFCKIRNFLHHFTYKFQIYQTGLCIAVNTNRFFKMTKGFGIKSCTDSTFLAGSNRLFRPIGNRTGTRCSDIGQYQWFISGIGNGIFYSYRMFPFNLPKVMRLFIGRKTGLGNGRQSNNKNS